MSKLVIPESNMRELLLLIDKYRWSLIVSTLIGLSTSDSVVK